MITLSTLTGQPINSYPTLRAVAYACEGMTDDQLWELSFVDEVKMRWVSWGTVRAEIEKIKRLRQILPVDYKNASMELGQSRRKLGKWV